VSRLSGELKIILGATFFALIPVGVKWGGELSVYSLLFGRLLVAALVILLISKNRSKLFDLKVKDLFVLVIWSLIMLFAMITYFISIRYCGMSIASALLGAQPIIVVLLAALLFRQKISSFALIASIIGFVGILCIVKVSDLLNPQYFLGELFGLVSAFLISLNFVYKKKFLNNFEAGDLVFYQSLLQLPFLIPFIWGEEITFSINSIGAVVLLGVVCTVMSYSLIYSGIKTVHPQKIGILQGIEYVLPVLIGTIFYQERPDTLSIIGTVLILLSCILVVGPTTKK
jgi:drug/metabolite transporter (DMT)-like permease